MELMTVLRQQRLISPSSITDATKVLGDLGEGALAWGWKVENPHLWASLRRAPEAMVSLQDAQAALWGG